MLLVFGPILYFSIGEAWIYFHRSEARAVDAASSKFRRICASEGLDPLSFSGPVPIPQRSDSYMFIWRRSEGEEITVSIMYFPYDVESSMSAFLIERLDRERNSQRSAPNAHRSSN